MASGLQKSTGAINLAPLIRPSELFRADLISAMKVPDSHQLEPNSYVEIKEPWRTEWEAGVQVCASDLPRISFKHGVRSVGQSTSCTGSLTSDAPTNHRHSEFKMPSNYMKGVNSSADEDSVSNKIYELDELDIAWIESVNKTRKYRALTGNNDLSEAVLQKAITTLERKCYQNMLQAIKTEESFQIEFDESVVCDICRDPEREENNEMIFCDSCNICVHQACYGVLVIPEGSWVCKPCGGHAQSPPCSLCPNRLGAMKKVKPSPGWAHISCALWIPEVKLGNVERMEPITNIEAIPANRWNLLCSVCRKREGACIQCSYPTCVAAYHVTCGFREGLEMRTQLSNGRVLHESYCGRHTRLRKTPTKNPPNHLDSPTNTCRPTRETQSTQIQHLFERFHDYVSTQDLTRNAAEFTPQLSSLILNYWILKRKSSFNRPLIPELRIDFSSQRLPSGMEYEKTMPEDENFLSIIHARHNLEMARNLVYMVQRRERLKRQKIVLSEEVTQLELKLLEEAMEVEEKRPNKQPLCLKRLGIVDMELSKKLSMENGEDVGSSGGSDSENGRVLRKKKNLRLLSSSDEQDVPSSSSSPKRCRRLSEGCAAMDRIVTLRSNNGQLSKGDSAIPFKQQC